MRDPWDWYLSLWAFGVGGRGGLRKHLTSKDTKPSSEPVRSDHPAELQSPIVELSNPVQTWLSVYDSADNIQSFRKWLNLISNPSHRQWLPEGYGQTAVSKFCGFMTYRYLYLCCQNSRRLRKEDKFLCYEDVERFDRNNCYIDGFIRQESLENDLCKALETLRPLTKEDRKLIYGAEKTNTSERPRLISDYYDEESIALVSRREKLLIDKFGYSPPAVTACNSVITKGN